MDSESVCRELEQGTPLLTATQRLARAWRGRYDAWQQARGVAVWPSADVLPLGAWVRRLAEAWVDAAALRPRGDPAGTTSAPVWLSDAQARMVWESVIGTSGAGRALLRSGAAARTAQEAHERLCQWRLAPPVPAADDPLEWRAFAGWVRDFTERCTEANWLDPARQADWIVRALEAHEIPLPPRVLLAGFDTLPPQTQAVLAAATAGGCTVLPVDPPRHEATAVRHVLPDTEAETWAAACWARDRLAANPAARIGIVVPNLTEQRTRWVRVLEDVLHPSVVLPGAEPGTRAFNLSQGIVLADAPVVADALRMLRISPAPQALETWSALLRGPFLSGAESERAERAQLDVRLRRRGAAELTAVGLASVAEESAPLLATALQAWRRAYDKAPARRQAPSAWAVAFANQLKALGWPGERALNSAEYQTVEAWRGLLEDLARLDLVAPTLRRDEALATLRRMARERAFQPEGSDAPVQVLGVLESGGLDFDHLWVAGLDEDSWPPPPRPNPLLPLALQRRHDMPRASAARELELAAAETERLHHAAPEVVFSLAAWDGDRPLRPSGLIADLPPLAPELAAVLAADAGPALRAAVGATGTLEPLADTDGPPVPAGAIVSGGTALFADQAACPFRAFARHRLHAAAPETPEPGLDPRQRGSLVHEALDALWGRLGSLEELQALDDAGLERTLVESADAAVATWMESNTQRLGARQAALERTRLHGLLADWLKVERRRKPFRVLEREEARTLEIGGITVQGRVDRMDQLPDGRHVLLDYKTGQPRTDAWWGPRPDEPQLPLYAVTTERPLAGVLFAQVTAARAGPPRFRGVAEDAAGITDATAFAKLRLPDEEAPPSGMDEVLARWRAVLEALAERFRAGMAEVDPKRADTCRYCELPGLCRIAELRPLGGEDAGDDTADGEDAP